MLFVFLLLLPNPCSKITKPMPARNHSVYLDCFLSTSKCKLFLRGLLQKGDSGGSRENQSSPPPPHLAFHLEILYGWTCSIPWVGKSLSNAVLLLLQGHWPEHVGYLQSQGNGTRESSRSGTSFLGTVFLWLMVDLSGFTYIIPVKHFFKNKTLNWSLT